MACICSRGLEINAFRVFVCLSARYIDISRDAVRKEPYFYHDLYPGEDPVSKPRKTKRCKFCDQIHRGACTPAAVERFRWKSVPPDRQPPYQQPSYQPYAQHTANSTLPSGQCVAQRNDWIVVRDRYDLPGFIHASHHTYELKPNFPSIHSPHQDHIKIRQTCSLSLSLCLSLRKRLIRLAHTRTPRSPSPHQPSQEYIRH